MRSRRAILAGLGTAGVAGLGGCSALPLGDGDDSTPDVSLSADDVEPLSWPDSPFPVAIPGALADAHRERGRELLAAVPTDPSVPNGAVAEELRSDRERAADGLDEEIDQPWPTDRLSEWRRRRSAAATVRGAHRAATGEGDGDSLRERRRTVREELGSFVADHEYRASTTLEVVLAHAPIETLLADCRRHSRPNSGYPAAPLANPFQAGEAVGAVELAEATLADAGRLREVYVSDRQHVAPQWGELIDASDRLRFALGESRSTVDDFLDVDEAPFDADLAGTPARELFDLARRAVEFRYEDVQEYRDEGDYARAVVQAGRTLAAIEVLRTTVEGIRDGAYRDTVTGESVTRTADRARAAMTTVGDDERSEFAVRLLRPALSAYDFVPESIEEGYTDAARAQGELAWAELYARAVPAATDFVLDRLE